MNPRIWRVILLDEWRLSKGAHDVGRTRLPRNSDHRQAHFSGRGRGGGHLMANQSNPRKLLMIMGTGCLVLAFLPWWSKRFPTASSFVVSPTAAKISQSVFTIGIPTSPWFERVNESQENRDGTVVYSNGSAYYPVCLSALLGIAGGVMVFVSRLRVDKLPA